MSWSCGAEGCRTHGSPEHQCPGWRLARIHASVGRGGRNNAADVRVIQGALNRFLGACGGSMPKADTDGHPSEALFTSLQRFQQRYFGVLTPDGRVDVGGNTYLALAKQLHVKRIAVNLSEQMVEAIENGCSVLNFMCVSGDSTHPTDPGIFQISRKQHPYRSRTYDVQMDYAMFFTQDGKALHQYHGLLPLTFVRSARQGVTDWFGSHGCVRLEEAAARTLYNWTPIRTRVTIF
jgi:hypothetical protein